MLSPYPNVILHEELASKPSHPHNTYTMHPMLAQLLDVLAVKYSQWVFKCSSVREREPNKVTIMGFLVLDKGNVVGKVGLDTRYHRSRGSEMCYKIYNERISKARERGSSTLTTNIKQAVRVIESFFTPAPIRERMGDLCLLGRNNLSMEQRRAERDLRDAHNEISPHIREYIDAHREHMMQWLSPDIAAKLVAKYELHDKLKAMQQMSQDANQMLTVLIEDDKYTVLHNGNISVLQQEGLSHELRQRLGMLKLVESGEALPNVGVRMRPDAFMITAPDNFSSEVQP
jgi:hypothetical protein